MANGDGGAVINATWRLVVPVGALSLLAALTLLVQKDAAIALDVARQHGNELLLANSRITVLEAEARKGERYTSNDAEKDFRYIQKDIDMCNKELEEHKRIQH
jgi:hypothetical protein